MKRLLLFLGTLFIVGIAIFLLNKQNKNNNVLPAAVVDITSTPTSTPALKQSILLNIEGTPTRISWIIVNPEQVELYSNLKDEYLSEQIKVDKSCQILVNGGFYSTENIHLGLFISNFETISQSTKSPTRNGFLWINDNNISIANSFPDINPRIALQTGPLLVKNDEALSLAINNDEPSRRIVAGITDDNKLIFLAFYRDSAEYEGPLLGQLPKAINLLEKQTGINILDAINLDGGKHSVFISNYVRLNELEHIGSYFCVK